MINEATYKTLNVLANHFYGLSYQYKGVSAGLSDKGYETFVSWESHERWKTAGMIEDFIEQLGRECILAKMAAPKQDFESLNAAILSLYEAEVATIKAVKGMVKPIFDIGDFEVVAFINKVLLGCVAQTYEVKDVYDQCNKLKGNNAGIYMHSHELYEEYSEKFEKMGCSGKY